MALRSRTRLVALTAAALSIPLVLAACGNGGSSGNSSASAPVTSIRVVDGYTDEPDKTTYQNLLDACGQEAGVTIQREVIPGADLIAKVLQMISSKTMPDVLEVDNPDLPQIAFTGALVPLSDLGLSADGEAKGVVSAGSYDGKVYALQPIANTIALFYNTDLFKAAGLKPPTTWDELKTTAAALTSGSRYGVAFSAAATYEGTWQFLPFMWSNGADETGLTSPQMAQAVQLWVDLVKSGSASSSVVNWSQADVDDQFIAGNAAMMVNGPWQIPVLDKHTDLHWAVVPIPTPSAGGTSVAPLGGEVWAVPNTGSSAREAAAAKVVACLNSDDNQLKLATTRQTVPTKTALQKKFVAQNPSMATFSEMVADARARTAKLGTKWPDAATKIYQALQLALVGGKTPQQALDQVSNG